MDRADILRINLALVRVAEVHPQFDGVINRALELIRRPEDIKEVLEVLADRGVTRELLRESGVPGINETLDKLGQ